MKKIFAEILTIGDEILYGQITNTNAQFISQALDQIGIKVIRHTSIGDQEQEILTALAEAESRADVTLITGGLGPTKDDITKKTLAKYFDTDLVIDEKVLQMVTDFFVKRGREMGELNKLQAAVPRTCKVLYNPYGTAPGMWLERNRKVFVSMPGVPFEMQGLMRDNVIPELQAFFETPYIHHKVIQTVGIGESMLAEKIENWEDNLPENIGLAYLPSLMQVKLRLTGFGDDKEKVIQTIEAEAEKVMPLIEKYVFGFDKITLEEAVGNLLLEQGKTISTAESCSGGYLAHLITKVGGSSRYYQGSVIAYANQIKAEILGVKQETLDNFGAVSEETIKEMAENIRLKFKTDIGVASSGVAGPDGGSPEKPVGTVWIAYADEQETYTKKLQLVQDRFINIQLTSLAILDLVRRKLKGVS